MDLLQESSLLHRPHGAHRQWYVCLRLALKGETTERKKTEIPYYCTRLSRCTRTGILTTTDQVEHTLLRKMMTPAFSFGNLKNYVSTFASSAARLVAIWEESARTGEVVSVHTDVTKLTAVRAACLVQ